MLCYLCFSICILQYKECIYLRRDWWDLNKMKKFCWTTCIRSNLLFFIVILIYILFFRGTSDCPWMIEVLTRFCLSHSLLEPFSLSFLLRKRVWGLASIAILWQWSPSPIIPTWSGIIDSKVKMSNRS